MFKTKNWNRAKNDQMGFSLSDLWSDKAQAELDKAIQDTKDKAVSSGIKLVTNEAGKLLDKVGATDPKNKAIIDQVIKDSVSSAQDSFFEKNKTTIYIASGVIGLGLIGLIALAVRKK